MYVPLYLRCLYWSTPALLAPLLILMIWKRFYRVRPVFFLYVTYEIGSISLLLLIQSHYTAYFYLNWFFTWADDFLTLLVIGEVYRLELKRYRNLQGLGTGMFYGAAIVLLAASVLLAVALPGISPDLSRRVSAILVIHRSVLMLQVGLLVLLLVFSRAMALPWRGFGLGIAVGLGLAAALQGVSHSLYTSHLLGRSVYVLVYAVAYPCGVLVWLVSGFHSLLFSPAPGVEGDAQRLDELRRSLTQPQDP